MPSPDVELSGVIGAMREHADAQARMGRPNLEVAFEQCRLILVEAACEDRVDLDHDQLGFDFGALDVE
jgi:hypothetical protein